MNYAGTELAALADAKNYYRWIVAECRQHLGRVVVEHGAGVGTFSTVLLSEPRIDKLLAVEPAVNLIPVLRERLSNAGDRVEVIVGTLEEHASNLRNRRVDTVVSVNVLEHIDDDRRTLAAMRDVLIPGGRVIVFVPAIPWLYGSLDRAFEHVRRYRRRDLVEKVSDAGFDVVSTRFMNLPGVLSWLAVGRVLRRTTLDPAAVKLYDRYVVPVVSRIEKLWPPPIGQNLLLVAQRRQSGA